MKILILPSSYFPHAFGGTEQYVRSMANAFAAQGHECLVAIHAGDASTWTIDTHRVVDLGALPACNAAEIYRRGDGERHPSFEKLLDEWRPDLLHFHAFSRGAGMAHAAAATARSIPYWIFSHVPGFLCLHGDLRLAGKEACDGRLDRRRCAFCLSTRVWPTDKAAAAAALSPLPWRALPRGPLTVRLAMPSLVAEAHGVIRRFHDGAARVIACAKWYERMLAANEIAGSSVRLLRQALPGAARRRKLRLPLREGTLRLGFLGRLDRTKGLDILAAALPLIRAKRDAICEVVGPIMQDPKDREHVEATLRTSDMTYLGPREPDAVRAWLAHIDLLVVPSRWPETGPLVVLEAWDAGTPTIGVDLGGTAEFHRSSGLASLLFAPESPAALAAAIERACEWRGAPPEVDVAGMDDLAATVLHL